MIVKREASKLHLKSGNMRPMSSNSTPLNGATECALSRTKLHRGGDIRDAMRLRATDAKDEDVERTYSIKA